MSNDVLDHALSSFTETQGLAPASLVDIEDYRTYLATESPIAEIETRFLDPTDDLVCLTPKSRSPSPGSSRAYSPFSDDALTPMPRKMTFGSSAGPTSRPSTQSSSQQGECSPTDSQEGEPSERAHAAAMATANAMFSLPIVTGIAVVFSMLAFSLITDFSGRIAVVLVTTLAVAALKRNLEMAQ